MLRCRVQPWKELGQLLDRPARSPIPSATPRHLQRRPLLFCHQQHVDLNKMVWHHTVAPGDIVVVDRNCYLKSILHSIIMTGAVPVFPVDAHPATDRARLRCRVHQGGDEEIAASHCCQGRGKEAAPAS